VRRAGAAGQQAHQSHAKGQGHDAPISGAWQAIAVAGGHVCAIDLGGALSCWGDGDTGVLGNGQLDAQTQPTPVSTVGTNVWLDVATSRVTTCGIQRDHTLWCWGANSVGQVGDDSTTMRASPVQIGTGTT
jgi:alpha-tubulin suppressor-like RCC1 family protein